MWTKEWDNMGSKAQGGGNAWVGVEAGNHNGVENTET